jgi:hypothetical protein
MDHHQLESGWNCHRNPPAGIPALCLAHQDSGISLGGLIRRAFLTKESFSVRIRVTNMTAAIVELFSLPGSITIKRDLQIRRFSECFLVAQRTMKKMPTASYFHLRILFYSSYSILILYYSSDSPCWPELARTQAHRCAPNECQPDNM